MTTVSHLQTFGPNHTGSELTSALGTLLERIEAETQREEPRTAYEMTAAEVDGMLGLHRAFDRKQVERLSPAATEPHSPPDAGHIGEDTPPLDQSLIAPEAIDELREGSVFERSIDRHTALLALALPILATAVVATVALWWGSRDGDAAPLESTASTAASTQSAEPMTRTDTVASATAETRAAPIERTDAAIADAVETALSTSGVAEVQVSVVRGTVTVDAVARIDLLQEGYFARVDELERLASVPGASEVHVTLELKGDPAMLRDELNRLSAERPILFDSGSTEIAEADGAILDAVAAAIAAQPGLPVVIAGTTDSSGSVESNERLAHARAEAVAAGLIERGIPENRLRVVSYGELFGLDHGSARTVRFEVGA